MSGFAVDIELDRRSSAGESFRLRAAFECDTGITVVSGPSGAGKSTLLLGVLGALRPRAGRVLVSGDTLFDAASGVDVPVRNRRVGMVFQDAALFPHLDVARNVAFGMPGTRREDRALELLRRVHAEELARRRPAELSGGQRQRVALARALAAAPRALLLDEPFSALDAPSRETLGSLLLQLNAESGIPFLHVTHDLGEALRLGERLVLLDEGRVVQTGRPADVVAGPASLPAARAVGTENLFSANVRSHDPEAGCTEVDLGGTLVQTGLLEMEVGSTVALGLRAEDVLVSLDRLDRTSARNVIAGRIDTLAPRGALVEARVLTPVPFRVLITPASVRGLSLASGKEVYLLIKATAFHKLV